MNQQVKRNFSGFLAKLHAALRLAALTVALSASGLAHAQFSQCRQFFPNGEPPNIQAEQTRELCFEAFAVLHSGKTKTPVFVVERLTREQLVDALDEKRTDKFYPEARLPSADRAQLSDYKGSGYDRGHMAPAGDMPTPESMAQSFSLANMVPQNSELNRGVWADIERDTRAYVKRTGGPVYVFTGPFYDSTKLTIGTGRVAVSSLKEVRFLKFKFVLSPKTINYFSNIILKIGFRSAFCWHPSIFHLVPKALNSV